MFPILSGARSAAARALAFAGLLALSACGAGPISGGPGGTVNVALLVPSGSAQSGDDLLAQNLENAARLAISDLDGVTVNLKVYSTAASADTAAKVASQAVDEGAQVILGPVFAASAHAAGQAVAGRGVNVLAFSNNPTVAGGNVYILGQTYADTAGRLIRYAAAQGKSSIAVVHDQTTAGDLADKAAVAAIQAAGATLALDAPYPYSQQGLVKAIPDIAKQVASSGADALVFTANTAGALPLATQLMSENGIDPAVTQYIGLTRWDIPATTLALPGVQHGWFALPDPALAQQFSTRYNAAYGTNPLPIASLAYDGIAAIGALVKQGGPDPLSAASLTQPSGFAGVDGIFRFKSDGTTQRGLAIGQILNNQVTVIDPAPTSFGGAGF
jgi:hypothetical protein